MKAFDYRLGNRSALEWVIDQYRVKTDEKRSGIVNDPNRADDEEYIVGLVGKVDCGEFGDGGDCGGVAGVGDCCGLNTAHRDITCC